MTLSYLIVVAIILIWIFLIRMRIGRGFSVIKVFNLVWFLTFVVYLLNLYKYFPVNDLVIISSIILVCSVNISFLLFKKGRSLGGVNTTSVEEDLSISNRALKIVVILSIISWLLSFQRLVISLGIIFSEGMDVLRAQTYLGDVYTTMERLIYQYFVQPLFTISVIFAVVILVFSKKKNYLFILVALINALVYSSLFGGRAMFVQFSIYAILLIALRSGDRIKEVFRSQKKVIVLLAIIAIPLVAISSLRVSRDWGVVGEFGLYMTAGPAFLTQLIDGGTLQMGVLNGRGLIGGVYDTFGLVLKLMGENVQLVSQTYSDCASEFLSVAPSVTTNFTAMSIATFLMDWGIFGVIVGGVFYGTLFAVSENFFRYKQSLFSLALYMYICYASIESIQNYTFKSVVPIFIFVYLWILFKPRRRVHI